MTAAIGKDPSAELGAPGGILYPGVGANKLPGAVVEYDLIGDPCPSGQAEHIGVIDVAVVKKSKGLWSLHWASYREDGTPCS
jgi:hypothetical protein